jgi:hypothetical protein
MTCIALSLLESREQQQMIPNYALFGYICEYFYLNKSGKYTPKVMHNIFLKIQFLF